MEKKNKTSLKKREKWTKTRHKVIHVLLRPVISALCKVKYGITVEKFAEQGDRQYLVLMNHQTAFDQFFVGMAFKGPVYYLATEDLFSKGWLSKLIRWLVAPIPIKKQTTDLRAVANCVHVSKEGGTICLAPEGNRTYSGITEYMKPSIVKFARVLKCPVAIFRIEGGYGIQPRWSDVTRKGKMKAYVSRVLEPEEIKALKDDELYDLIVRELYVNEACVDGEYHHKDLAQYMERALYVCPYCGLTVFESHGDIIECKSCHRQMRYLPTKELEGVGFEFLHRFVADWYNAQSEFVHQLDLEPYKDTPMYEDDICLSEVILYKNKNILMENTKMRLYGNRITIDGLDKHDGVLDFDKISVVTVLGRNKLNIYYGDDVYQMKGDKRFNALKYVNIFYHYKNINGGNEDGKFLGL